ncbi:MAG: BatA domain-containing protein, partial [Pseudomonadota bacterium]
MSIGPFLFGAPLALLGLLALPVIWILMRATPPAPQLASLPSLRLLDGLDPKEETPARTPWWIRLLRFLAVLLAIFGLAQPVYAPDLPENAGEGPVLIVIDDGWASAERFGTLVDSAVGHLTTLDRDRGFHLLTTAPNIRPVEVSRRYSRQEITEQIRALEPQSVPSDRPAAMEAFEASGVRPTDIFWASNGLDAPSTTEVASGEQFASDLAEFGRLTVYTAPPRGPVAITDLETDGSGVTLGFTRVNLEEQGQRFVSALSNDSRSLASVPIEFEPGAYEGTATFTLPPATLSRITRFQVIGGGGPGTNWLWDSADRRPLIGLVTDAEAAQPLLSDVHYVRRALSPFSVIEEGTL